MNSFGTCVRQLRDERGVSVRAFARSIGKSPAWVSKMERDLEQPGTSTVQRIAQVLESDVDILLAKARKVPPDLEQIIFQNPKAARLALASLQTK